MSDVMDEEQFKRINVEKHQKYFSHFYRLHQLAQDSLQKYKGFTADPNQAAIVLIFPRAFKAYDSIRMLCEVWSCEDAAVILRCLLNLMVLNRWISQKPQERASKYLAWYWVEMYRQTTQRPDKFPSHWIEDIQRHFDRVKSKFEYTDPKGKKKFARHWYEPEVRSIYDLFKEVDLEGHYTEAYGLSFCLELSTLVQWLISRCS